MENRKQQQQDHHNSVARRKKKRMRKQDTSHLWLLGAAIVCLYSFLGYQYYQHYYCSALSLLQEEENYVDDTYRPLCLQISSNVTHPIQPQARVLILMGMDGDDNNTLLETIPVRQFEAILLFGFHNSSHHHHRDSHVFSLNEKSRLLLDNTLFVGSSLSSHEQELETLIDTLDMLEDGQRVVVLSQQMPLLSSELIHVLQLNQDILSLWIYADTEGEEPVQRVEQGITFVSNPVRDTLFCL